VVIVLFVIAVVLCTIVFIFLVLRVSVQEALSFTVVLLLGSIPLAIEIVTTTTLAIGSKEMAECGAVVTRLSAIEDMAGMSILCSDKTGTLTMNKMVIQEETPVYKEGETQDTLLRYAAMAAKWWEPPRDALDTLVLNAVDKASMDTVKQIGFMPFDPIVKRTEGTVREKDTGAVYRTTKGAPHVVLHLTLNQPHDAESRAAAETAREAMQRDLQGLVRRGIRSLAVARTNDKGLWEMLGLLTFLDPPRPDTKQTIEDAQLHGVVVKMITGDRLPIARETARQLGMGDYIQNSDGLPLLDTETKKKPENLSRDYGDMILAADGFAQVFPEHKYLIVECLREMGYKVGMTGDGVNDAPALKRADVGVAVQGATDAARAAADIVLTEPGLSAIIQGILVARRIFVRLNTFLSYRFCASLQMLVFFFIAVFAFKPIDYMPADWETRNDFPDDEWEDYFTLPALMLMIMTLMNNAHVIAIGYDNAEARMVPEKWNLPVLIVVNAIEGSVGMIATLLLLYLSLSSWDPDGIYQKIGLGGLSYGQITTSIFLQLSVSQYLTLYAVRAGPNWFWAVRPPSAVLLTASGLALTVSTLLATLWPRAFSSSIPTRGLAYRHPHLLPLYIWIYSIVWFLIEDVVKVTTYYVIRTNDLFGYNDTGKLVMPVSAAKYGLEHKELESAKGEMESMKAEMRKGEVESGRRSPKG
jgi:H+-transporting ATPase